MRYVTLSIVCLVLTACGEPEESPEQEVRDWVTRGIAAAEDKDRGELLDMISSGYADARGNDRDNIGDILRAYFFRHNSITLLVDIDDIVVSGETAALVDLTVGMAGTNAHAPGLRADAYNFQLELQKPDDEWLLIGARWGSLGRDLH